MLSAGTSECVGVSRDLPVVKVKISEGLVARLLMVGIVHIVVVLISKSSGAFLQNSQRTRALPAVGHLTREPCPFCFLKHFLF